MALKLTEFARPYLEGMTAVRGVLPGALTVGQLFPLPDGVAEVDVEAAALADVLTVVAVEKDLDVADVAFRLGSMGEDAFAVLLLGWPTADLPWHRLIDAVATADCQLIDVEPLGATRFPTVAAVVRGSTLRVPRPYLMGGRHARAPEPADVDAERRMARRAISELVVATADQRRLRTCLEEASAAAHVQHAEAEAVRTSQATSLIERLGRAERELASAQERLAALRSSTTMRLGSAVAGARRPSGVVALPRELLRIARLDRRRRSAG